MKNRCLEKTPYLSHCQETNKYVSDKIQLYINNVSRSICKLAELAKLFAGSKAGLVYVTAFPNRSIMGRYLGEIAWETEVWVADAPSHLIHFNGVRFLGPYPTE
jgi:hypothetical protein